MKIVKKIVTTFFTYTISELIESMLKTISLIYYLAVVPLKINVFLKT